MDETDEQFNARLTDALRHGTEEVLPTPELAASARTLRATRRKRRLVSLGTAGAVVAAVVVAFALPHGGGSSNPSPAGSNTTDRLDGTSWIPDGFRSESVGDIELAVPKSWPYGDLTQWCIAQYPELPMFSRPGGVSTSVGCLGPGGFGVQFVEPSKVDPDATTKLPGGEETRAFPEGAAVRTKVIGNQMVLLVLKDAQLADQVIKSVHQIKAYDANGCAPEEVVPKAGEATTVAATTGPISVCRYSGNGTVSLEKSELLTGADADDLRAAIAAAPAGTGPDQGEDECTDIPGEAQPVILLRTTTGPLAWVRYGPCRGKAIDLGSSTKKITADVLHWVFSPGYSGAIPGGLNFEFRELPGS
jgi:hypothetical protein